MKKSMKAVLIAGCALVIVGVLLCGVSFMMSGGDPSRYSTPARSFSRLSYNADAAAVTALDVTEVDREVRLQPAEDGEVTVSYCEMDGEGYEIELHGGVLSIKREVSTDWREAININIGIQPDDALIISLPASFGGDMAISSTSGRITLDGFVLGDLALSAVSGAVNASDLQVSALDVSVTSGNVKLQNCRCDSGSVSLTSGKLTMTDIDCAGAWEFSVTSGAITLTDCVASSVKGETNSGEMKFSALDAADVDLKSTSGGITGSLAGSSADYSINSRAENGESNLESRETDAPRWV